jgi:hypothetical protein
MILWVKEFWRNKNIENQALATKQKLEIETEAKSIVAHEDKERADSALLSLESSDDKSVELEVSDLLLSE